jgi:hypothetical protein
MEPESSLLYSQVLATSPNPEPTPSSPHNPLQHRLCIVTASIYQNKTGWAQNDNSLCWLMSMRMLIRDM